MFYARFGQTNGPMLGRVVEPYVLAKVNPSPRARVMTTLTLETLLVKILGGTHSTDLRTFIILGRIAPEPRKTSTRRTLMIQYTLRQLHPVIVYLQHLA